jgi:uncharacterized protein YjbI with pentapeptide repeats
LDEINGRRSSGFDLNMEKSVAPASPGTNEKMSGDQDGQRAVALRIIVAVGILAVGLLVGWFVHSDETPVHTSDAAQVVATGNLAQQNLRAEIALERAQSILALEQAASAKASNSDWRQLITPGASLLAALLSALVAYLAIVMPLNRQRKRTAEEDVIQREKDRTQRFDTGFSAAVIALGDEKIVIQAGGAAALQSLLQHSPDEFKDQVYRVVRANLDIEIGHAGAVKRLLIDAFSSALQILSPKSETRQGHRTHSDGRGYGWDLARTEMAGADLRNVDLSSADVAFSNLAYANLDGAWLRRCWGYKVNLEGASLRDTDLEEARLQKANAPKASFDRARLVSARLDGSDLSGAHFRDARLQSAHFRGANLSSVDFRDANVDDADFRGAHLDDATHNSLILTTTWKPLASKMSSKTEIKVLEDRIQRFLDPSDAQALVALGNKKRSSAGSAPEDAQTQVSLTDPAPDPLQSTT